MVDTISRSNISITTVANHAQYQLATNAAALDQLLTDSAAAGRKFTHAYYWPPHYPAYFDAQCSKVQHGTPYPPSDSNHKSP